MMDKGYLFPLYSLDLGTPPDPYHFIQTDEGTLIAAPALLRRAQTVNSAACRGAVETVLQAHPQHEASFARHGLTGAWRQSLAHWAARLTDCEQSRTANLQERQVVQEDAQGKAERGRELWHAVVVLSRLAGMAGMTGGISAPREPQALGRALLLLQERMVQPEIYTRLCENGLDEGLVAELAEISSDLCRLGAQREQHAERNRLIAGELLVIRAGIFGDLSRFAQIASIALPRSVAATLQLQRLLPMWRRSVPGVRSAAQATEACRGS